MQQDSSTKIYAYIGAAAYLLLVLLLLFIFKLRIPPPVIIPPEGIDVLTPIEAIGGGPGGGESSGNNQSTGGTTSSNVASSTSSNPTHTTNPNTNNTHNTSGNNWGDAWSNAGGTSGGTGTNGAGGGTNGGDGGIGTGSGPCKGCPGSGNTLGEGDAVYSPKPSINNGDDGVIKVKVFIDKDGNVVGVVEKGNQGTSGDISDDSYRIVRENAFKWKFKPDPKAGSQNRTGYIKYTLRPN